MLDSGPVTIYFGGCHVLDKNPEFGPIWWGLEPFCLASGIYWNTTFLVKKSMIVR